MSVVSVGESWVVAGRDLVWVVDAVSPDGDLVMLRRGDGDGSWGALSVRVVSEDVAGRLPDHGAVCAWLRANGVDPDVVCLEPVEVVHGLSGSVVRRTEFVTDARGRALRVAPGVSG